MPGPGSSQPVAKQPGHAEILGMRVRQGFQNGDGVRVVSQPHIAIAEDGGGALIAA